MCIIQWPRRLLTTSGSFLFHPSILPTIQLAQPACLRLVAGSTVKDEQSKSSGWEDNPIMFTTLSRSTLFIRWSRSTTSSRREDQLGPDINSWPMMSRRSLSRFMMDIVERRCTARGFRPSMPSLQRHPQPRKTALAIGISDTCGRKA